MNAAWFRKLASDELCETLMYGALAKDYKSIKTKETDNKGKTFYRLKMTGGEILVYSPKTIYINSHKCFSVSDAKKHIQYNYVQA